MPADRPKQIGGYKVVAEIGRGGYGRVYRALDIPARVHPPDDSDNSSWFQ